MLFQGILASTLVLLGGVQANSYDGGAAKREAEQGMVNMVHVDVGKDGQLLYSPEKVTAAAGEMVQFTFYPKVKPTLCAPYAQ
jgi:plastocyanin